MHPPSRQLHVPSCASGNLTHRPFSGSHQFPTPFLKICPAHLWPPLPMPSEITAFTPTGSPTQSL